MKTINDFSLFPMNDSYTQALFCGRSTEDNTLVYGCLLTRKEMNKQTNEIETTCYLSNENHSKELNTLSFIKVHPNSIGQYTGIQDKNEFRVYSGDIVKRALEEYVVLWDKVNARFELCTKQLNPVCGFNKHGEQFIEVIGRLSDNMNWLDEEVFLNV